MCGGWIFPFFEIYKILGQGKKNGWNKLKITQTSTPMYMICRINHAKKSTSFIIIYGIILW